MEEKETAFDDILKMGRTQLQDAVPMRLGQSFGAFAHVLKRDIKRLKNVMDEMKILNIGATAIGTAINVDPYYLANISYELSKVTGISVKELVLQEGLLKEEELKEILKPEKMTQPAREKVMKAVS